MKKFIFIFTTFIYSTCLASNYNVSAQKMEGQKEMLKQGEVFLISDKLHSVMIHKREKSLKNGNGSFYFSCANNSNSPINLYFHNLTCTDQFGRSIPVLMKKELIADKKTKTRWKHFGAALCTALEACQAESTSDVVCQTVTHDHQSYHVTSHDPNGWSDFHGHVDVCDTTTTIMPSQRDQEMSQVYLNADLRDACIEDEYESYANLLNNHYFDSNTVFPNSIYEGLFQIYVPRNIEKKLEYIFVNVDFGCERHTFCFCCSKSKNRRLA